MRQKPLVQLIQAHQDATRGGSDSTSSGAQATTLGVLHDLPRASSPRGEHSSCWVSKRCSPPMSPSGPRCTGRQRGRSEGWEEQSSDDEPPEGAHGGGVAGAHAEQPGVS
jgi:hypothetical protein